MKKGLQGACEAGNMQMIEYFIKKGAKKWVKKNCKNKFINN